MTDDRDLISDTAADPVAEGYTGDLTWNAADVSTPTTGLYNTTTYDDTDLATDADLTDNGTADQDVDSDVIQARERVEETRSNLAGTIDAIQEKLSPENLAQQAKDTVKEATVGRVQHAIGGAGSTVSDTVSSAQDTAAGFGQSIMNTIRQNPIPAGIVGFGLGWMLMSSRNSDNTPNRSYNNGYSRGYTPSGGYREYGSYDTGSGSTMDNIQGTVSGAAQGAQDTASQAMDTVQNAAQSAQDMAGQAAGQISDTASQIGNQAQYGAQQAMGSAQGLMQSNPLAVGAIALALGAAVGLAIPETQKEDELMGSARQSLMDEAQQKAQDTIQKVSNVAGEVVDSAKTTAQEQAQQQGLTQSK